MIARGDALRELAKLGTAEHVAKLRLAEQDDLQELLRRRFEIGQQAHLLERIDREVLRLVDDEHDAKALRVRIEQIRVQRVGQRLEAAAAAGDVELELLAHRLDELDRRELRIQHQRNPRVLRQLLEQQPTQRRLAGADLARQLHEAAAAALADAIEQVRQRIAVAFGQEHVARVRRDRERRLAQPVVFEVHGGATLPEGCSIPC